MSQLANGPKSGRKLKGKEREEQLLRAQRLENMGLLAARVAHDLNNMLSPMTISLPMLRPSVSDAAGLSVLASLEASVVRITALVRQILDYAEGTGGQLELVLIQDLLAEVGVFAEKTFPRNIAVKQEVPGDLWQISANLSQIHQVLLNLCVNARDAMADRGGTLTLRAENCRLTELAATQITGGRAGNFLVLQVDDTGTGFSPAIISRMWEPFITTKKAGKGSGLGLSTIREVISHHNGFIQLTTEEGRGSSFRIYLPATSAAPVKVEQVGQQVRPMVDAHT